MGTCMMGNMDGLGADGSIESSSGSKHPVSGSRQIRLMARRAKAATAGNHLINPANHFDRCQ